MPSTRLSAAITAGMALTRRAAAVALPPSAGLSVPSVAWIDTSSRGRPSIDQPMLAGLAGSRHRPVGREFGRDTGDVLDHEPRRPLDDADHLEPEGTLGAGVEATLHRVDRLVELESFDRLGDLVDLDAETVGHRVDHRTPDHRRHRRDQHRRELVERLAETDHLADDLRGVVGRVVEQLLHPDLVDATAHPAHEQREDVLGPSRIDARHVDAAAALVAGVVDPGQELLVGGGRVEQPVDRRGDHAGPGPQAREHVVEGVVGAGVAARCVDDRVGSAGRARRRRRRWRRPRRGRCRRAHRRLVRPSRDWRRSRRRARGRGGPAPCAARCARRCRCPRRRPAWSPSSALTRRP